MPGPSKWNKVDRTTLACPLDVAIQWPEADILYPQPEPPILLLKAFLPPRPETVHVAYTFKTGPRLRHPCKQTLLASSLPC